MFIHRPAGAHCMAEGTVQCAVQPASSSACAQQHPHELRGIAYHAARRRPRLEHSAVRHPRWERRAGLRELVVLLACGSSSALVRTRARAACARRLTAALAGEREHDSVHLVVHGAQLLFLCRPSPLRRECARSLPQEPLPPAPLLLTLALPATRVLCSEAHHYGVELVFGRRTVRRRGSGRRGRPPGQFPIRSRQNRAGRASARRRRQRNSGRGRRPDRRKHADCSSGAVAGRSDSPHRRCALQRSRLAIARRPIAAQQHAHARLQIAPSEGERGTGEGGGTVVRTVVVHGWDGLSGSTRALVPRFEQSVEGVRREVEDDVMGKKRRGTAVLRAVR